MRALPLLVLFASSPALAGVCTLTMGDHDETVRFDAGKPHTHVYKLGRWPIRLTLHQAKNEAGDWVFDVKVEKPAKDGPETIWHPKLTTGKGLDTIAETTTKMGPTRLHCRD